METVIVLGDFMGIDYLEPPDYDEETQASSDLEDECPWKKLHVYEGDDHYADDIEYEADDIL